MADAGDSYLGEGVGSKQHQGKAGGVLGSHGEQELGAVLGTSHPTQHSAHSPGQRAAAGQAVAFPLLYSGSIAQLMDESQKQKS